MLFSAISQCRGVWSNEKMNNYHCKMIWGATSRKSKPEIYILGDDERENQD